MNSQHTSRATLVYVSGPFTQGSVGENIHYAAQAGRLLRREGYAVIVPHNTLLEDIVFPITYESWIQHDLRLISCCDVILRIPGLSLGAEREVKCAREFGIPVYYNIEELIRNEPVYRGRVREQCEVSFRSLSDVLREAEEGAEEAPVHLPPVRGT